MALFGRGRRRQTVFNPNDVSGVSLTASGERVTAQSGQQIQQLVPKWQGQSFYFYDALGEIKYASQFYARGLSQLELFVGEITPGEDGKPEVNPTEDETVKAVLDRIQDPGGGRTGLLSAYGRLMFLTGEAYLVGTQDPDTGGEQWEMLSTEEVKFVGSTLMRYQAPSLRAEEYRQAADDDFRPIDDAGTAVAYRLWQRHPRYSMLPDCTMQGVLELCEELILLTKAVRSRTRSRLAGAGILFVADDISPRPLEAGPDEDPDEDPFIRDLTEAMTTPITDEGKASAVVPLVVRASLESIKDGVRHVQLVDPTQLYPETGLRYECIKRIAIGLDMPPEILMGLGDSNHWSAWQIDEQTWKSHLMPKAQQLVEDLTSAFLRPTLQSMGVQDWARYVVAYDATKIINHPDRTKDAKDLYQARAIGKAALREAGGFTDDDAPTEEERAEMVGIATRDSSLAWDGIPSVKAGGIETSPGVVTNAQGTGGTPTGPSTGSEVEPGPPPGGPEEPPDTVNASGNGNGHASVNALTSARLLGACELAVLRARELAGSRIRSRAKRDPETLRMLEKVRNGQAAAFLGQPKVTELGFGNAGELIAGSRELIADALRVFGTDDERIVKRVCDSVEKHAARTLFDEKPAPLPPAFLTFLETRV